MLTLARLLLGIGIPLYLFIPIASPPGYFEHDAPRIPLALIGGGLAAAGALLARLGRPGGGIGATGVAALAFAGLQGLSIFAAENRRETFDPVAVTAAGAAFFLALRLLPGPARGGARRRILAALPLLGGGLAAYGLAQHLGIDPIAPGVPAWPIGTLGNLNLVCAVLGPLFVLGFLCVPKALNRWKICLSSAAVVLLFTVLLFTGQRGWVVVITFGFLAAWLAAPVLQVPRSKIQRWLFFGLVAEVVIFLLMSISDDRFRVPDKRFSVLGVSSDRYGVWAETLGMIRDQPLTGVGPGNFVVRFPPYRKGVWYTVRDDFDSIDFETFPDPHNGYLQVAAESGVPALVALLALLGLGFRGAVRAARSGATEEERIDGRALAGFLGAAAAGGVLYPFAESALVAAQLWVGLAVAPQGGATSESPSVGGSERLRVGASERPPDPSDSPTLRRSDAQTFGPALLALLVLVAAGLLPAAVRRFQANHAFNHALRDIRHGREAPALADLARAEALDPANWKIHFHGGRIAEVAKKDDEALRHADAAVERSPRDVVLRLTRGLLLLKKGERARARADFEAARTTAPGFFLPAFQLGRIRLGDGEAAAAAELFAEALRLEPRFGKGLAFLGMAEAVAGRKEPAAAALGRLKNVLPRLDVAGLIAAEAETSPAVKKALEAGVFTGYVGGESPPGHDLKGQ